MSSLFILIMKTSSRRSVQLIAISEEGGSAYDTQKQAHSLNNIKCLCLSKEKQ